MLIDGEVSPGNYRGRAFFQAPEVDGTVLVRTNQPLMTGEFVKAVLTRVYGYDLLGEV